jgi:5-methylcytosine-specific restriction protein B
MSKKSPMTLADKIRLYVIKHKIEPARARGETMITLFAREVHADMHLPAPIRAVESALDDPNFESYADVRLLERSGRKGSPKAKWVFAIE